jgi:hypothetical protein
MLQTKALYNLLRLNAAEDPTVEVDSWAIENLRLLSEGELFSRLQKQGVDLTTPSFQQFAHDCDTPEELTEVLLPDHLSEKERDPFYLVVFELWRRFVPEKQSLSIFCDELDHRIALYDEGDGESDELIQDGLANLLEVLNENADAGADPEEIFLAICDYCAHDLEAFIYDYITELLDGGNCLYASELIEGFAPFVIEPQWFDFLRVRLLSFTDIGDANLAMHRLLESELELPLVLEMLHFLSSSDEYELFPLCLKKIIPLLATQEELTDTLLIIQEHYRHLDEPDRVDALEKLIEKRQSLEGPLTPNEPDLRVFTDFVTV